MLRKTWNILSTLAAIVMLVMLPAFAMAQPVPADNPVLGQISAGDSTSLYGATATAIGPTLILLIWPVVWRLAHVILPMREWMKEHAQYNWVYSLVGSVIMVLIARTNVPAISQLTGGFLQFLGVTLTMTAVGSTSYSALASKVLPSPATAIASP